MASGICTSCGKDAYLWEGYGGRPVCGKCRESEAVPISEPFRSWSGEHPLDVARRLRKLAKTPDPENVKRIKRGAARLARLLSPAPDDPSSRLDETLCQACLGEFSEVKATGYLVATGDATAGEKPILVGYCARHLVERRKDVQ